MIIHYNTTSEEFKTKVPTEKMMKLCELFSEQEGVDWEPTNIVQLPFVCTTRTMVAFKKHLSGKEMTDCSLDLDDFMSLCQLADFFVCNSLFFAAISTILDTFNDLAGLTTLKLWMPYHIRFAEMAVFNSFVAPLVLKSLQHACRCLQNMADGDIDLIRALPDSHQCYLWMGGSPTLLNAMMENDILPISAAIAILQRLFALDRSDVLEVFLDTDDSVVRFMNVGVLALERGAIECFKVLCKRYPTSYTVNNCLCKVSFEYINSTKNRRKLFDMFLSDSNLNLSGWERFFKDSISIAALLRSNRQNECKNFNPTNLLILCCERMEYLEHLNEEDCQIIASSLITPTNVQYLAKYDTFLLLEAYLNLGNELTDLQMNNFLSLGATTCICTLLWDKIPIQVILTNLHWCSYVVNVKLNTVDIDDAFLEGYQSSAFKAFIFQAQNTHRKELINQRLRL